MEIRMTLDELTAIIEAAREKETKAHEFAAALKGIKLDKSQGDAEVERVKRNAEAQLRNTTPQQVFFEDVGIDYGE